MKVPLLAVVVCAGSLWSVACSEPVSPLSPSLAAPAALTSTVASGVEEVPFKGSFEGTQRRTGVPPLVHIDGSATGTASLLGRFTVEFPHTVDVETLFGKGTYTFTAANGDTLTAHFTGQGQANGSIVAIVEQATITGGTGRFVGATGSFVVERQFDRSTGMTHGSFAGTISPPNAGRS